MKPVGVVAWEIEKVLKDKYEFVCQLWDAGDCYYVVATMYPEKWYALHPPYKTTKEGKILGYATPDEKEKMKSAKLVYDKPELHDPKALFDIVDSVK